MFVSNDGTEINADVNAAYQILRKAFPDKEIVCDLENGLHPEIITVYTQIKKVDLKLKEAA